MNYPEIRSQLDVGFWDRATERALQGWGKQSLQSMQPRTDTAHVLPGVHHRLCRIVTRLAQDRNDGRSAAAAFGLTPQASIDLADATRWLLGRGTTYCPVIQHIALTNDHGDVPLSRMVRHRAAKGLCALFPMALKKLEFGGIENRA
jgi:hypothetical protein